MKAPGCTSNRNSASRELALQIGQRARALRISRIASHSRFAALNACEPGSGGKGDPDGGTRAQYAQ